MSRTAEEQLLLDERIQAMKRKNEELRRRHMEVEADKQTAAKQNALVKMNVPHDDDWVPGRVVENPRQDRSQPNEPLSPSAHDRSDERSQWPDQRRNRQFEDGSTPPKQNSQNFAGRRGDYQGNRQRSDGDRAFGNDNRRSGDWSNRSNDGGGRSREWGPQSNRGYRNSAPSGSGDGSKGYPTTFTSKVFKNSSMDADRGKRPGYRLAEGDGPPPDPSYSFLGDSMRDSPESGDNRRGNPKRGFPRSRGRGGQSWNNRGFNRESSNGDFEDRAESQPRNHDDPKQDEWRRERSKIDQERINRQKTSDGNWSREWDNNKVLQEGADRPHRWRRGNQNQNYGYNQPRRGYHDNSNNMPKQSYTPRGDNAAAGVETAEDAQSSARPPFGRRGRFSHQQRFKENPRFSNGSSQQASQQASEANSPKEINDAALIDSNVTSVEKLQVSLVCDASGAQMRRSVEGLGGNLRVSVSKDEESSDSKNLEQKRQHKRVKKVKRNRVFSSTSTGTTGTAEEDDESWEDLSSDEEAVSVLTDLAKVPRGDMAKCVDVSSGPESLDPVPAPGKEDEFLWDDFHPAGFQDNENVTLHLTAEAAYQALLDEKAKQVAAGEDCGDAGITAPPQVSFRLDTACLEDSGDELEGAKLDPLLVTTQIVQAEVDCMSLTSLPTDTSITEEVSQLIKTIQEEGGSKASDTEVKVFPEGVVKATGETVSAEELSGPVSILDVPQKEVSTIEPSVVDNGKLEVTDAVKNESEKPEAENKEEPEKKETVEKKPEDKENPNELSEKADLREEVENNENSKETPEQKEELKPELEQEDVKSEPEQKEDCDQKSEQKEDSLKKDEKKEDIPESVLANVPSAKETSKAESAEGTIEESAPIKNSEDGSADGSITVSAIENNGDASDVSHKSPTVPDEKILSVKETAEVKSLPDVSPTGTPSNISITSVNTSDKVATGQENDS